MAWASLFMAVGTLLAIAVYLDATRHGIGQVRDGSALDVAGDNLPAGGWAFGTLLCWVLVAPAYLVRRPELLARAARQPVRAERVARKIAWLLAIGAALAAMVMPR